MTELSQLHEYLRVCSGASAAVMFRQLECARRLGSMWPGVPITREDFDAGLEQLARDGLAKQIGVEWHWLPVRRMAVVEPQRELFA